MDAKGKYTEAQRQADLEEIREKLNSLSARRLFIFKIGLQLILAWSFMRSIPRRWAEWQAGRDV